MHQSLVQTIIARACNQPSVAIGDIVTCQVDLAMIHDSGGPRKAKPILDQLGVRVWDPAKIVVISDHYVPAYDAETAAIQKLTRDWVAEQNVENFHDMQGICHVVLPERGHLRPGLFVVGGDSHSPTGGAFGAFMFGIGATEMAGVLATGEIWIKVPATIAIALDGDLNPCVAAKDIMLHLCGRLGMDGARYQAIQYTGPAIAHLPMTERMTLCNMSAELGAQTALIAPDAVTAAFLRAAGVDCADIADWKIEPISTETHIVDLATLGPQVAAPHSPANTAPVESYAPTHIDQAYIGACTGAKLNDLHMAADILRGRTVARGTRLLVAPASTRIAAQAAADGTLATLTASGAILLASGCGACAGYGAGLLADGEVCIASTARNFKGRMGAPTSRVYLASPYTVAASAIAGRIADPRDILA